MLLSTRRSHCTIGIAAVLLLAGTAFADEASRKAKAEEVLKLTNSEQMMKQMIDRARAMQTARASKLDLPEDQKAQAEALQNKIMQVISDRMSWEKLKPQFVQIYADTYTDEELDGIVAFYKSPAGQAMLAKMPEIMTKSMKVAQDAMQGVEADIRRITDEAKQAK
jgi:hypothetical protein